MKILGIIFVFMVSLIGLIGLRYGSVSPCGVLKKQTLEHIGRSALQAGQFSPEAAADLDRRLEMGMQILTPWQCGKLVLAGIATMDPDSPEAEALIAEVKGKQS